MASIFPPTALVSVCNSGTSPRFGAGRTSPQRDAASPAGDPGNQGAWILNMGFLVKYIVVFLTSLVAAWLLVPVVKRMAPWLRMVDEPDERRIHKVPIPRCGGIAVFIATHLGLIVVFLGPWRHLAGSTQLREWGFIFAGSLLLLSVGIFDDRFDMRAWFKLLGQLVVGLLMFFGGFTFGGFLHMQLPYFVDMGVTLFWFALLINAFNLIDGMDGACAGLGMIASAGLAGMLLSLHQPTDALVLVALVGACLGFLRYNFNPASIFLGDCGSMFIGFMLAAVSLKANVKQSMIVALIVPLLAVGVPVFDVMMAVWRRMARKLVSMINKDGLATKVFGPDLDHIHHKLMRSGMTQRKAAIALYGAAIFVCVVALGATAMTSNRTALLMIGMIVVLHVVVRQVAQVELWTTTQVVLQGVRRPRNVIGLLVAIGWDLCCLLLATYFVFGVVLGQAFSFLHLAVCVSIPFATIYFYSVYKTVWTRSRVSQLVVLMLQLAAGEALAYVALLWASDLSTPQLALGLVLHTMIACGGIVGARAALRTVRDLNAWLKCSLANDYDIKTLILGAGENAILYLRQASFEDQQKAPRRIVGLIDDNPALYHKVVYGYPVLGNFDELEAIIQEHGINELIFTHHYSEELRARILALHSKYEIIIRDFVFVLRDLDQDGACNGIVKPYSVHELDCRNLFNRNDQTCILDLQKRQPGEDRPAEVMG
jgi:UDP-GlcNAc:undecaprenyl-phosphate GlcNAc-1-phosphate transferase